MASSSNSPHSPPLSPIFSQAASTLRPILGTATATATTTAQYARAAYNGAELISAQILQVYNIVSAVVSSKSNQQKAITALVFSVEFIGLFILSVLSYALFAYFYLPQVSHNMPVYLQYPEYETSGSPLMAEVIFTLPKGKYATSPTNILKPDQLYDFELSLHVPDSQSNFDLGNFMVTLELQSTQNKSLISSRRPALIQYKSSFFRHISTLYSSFSLLYAFTLESHTLHIPLIDSFASSPYSPVTRALITLSEPNLRIYNSHLEIKAHFTGVRYYMAHHPILTGAGGVAFLMFWYATFGVILGRMAVKWIVTKIEEMERIAAENAAREKEEKEAKEREALEEKEGGPKGIDGEEGSAAEENYTNASGGFVVEDATTTTTHVLEDAASVEGN